MRNSLLPEQDHTNFWVRARDAILSRMLSLPDNFTPSWWIPRCLLIVFVAVWGAKLTKMDYRSGEMGSSFMHAILLPFHEAGHVIFSPFGEFMMILGGSAMQLLVPLVVAGTLLWKNRDPFGCMIGLWWFSISCMDLSAYIYDAKSPQLVLLGGHTGDDGPHDWIYLLGYFNKIELSQHYGMVIHFIGTIFMIIALIGAGAVVARGWLGAQD